MDLFLASGKAVSTLATILAFGLLWGTYPKPHGVLTPAAVKAAASLVMYVFSPCLLLSTYGQSLSLDVLQNTLAMALWCVIHILVSYAVGRATLPLSRAPANLAGVYRIALIWGNAASLPFLLLSTLVQREKLRADEGAFTRGIAYAFSYLIPWWLTIYSLGIEIMSPPAAAPTAASGVAASAGAGAGAPGAAPPLPRTDAQSVILRTLQQPPVAATFAGILLGLTPLRGLFWGSSPPLEGMGSVISLLGGGSIPTANIVLAGSLFSAVCELRKEVLAWMGEEEAAPALGGLAALAASASLFARAARRRVWGSGGRVLLVDGALAGGAAGEPAPQGKAEAVAAAPPGSAEGAGEEATFFSPHTMGVIIAVRLVLCPAINFALYHALARAWQVPLLVSSDPMVTLVVLLQAAMPSAQTLLIVASNVGNDKAGRALSLLFILQYPVATLLLIPWLMIAISWAGV